MAGYDSKGIYRNDGDEYYDGEGYLRGEGENYYDAKGYLRGPNDNFYDYQGILRAPGDDYYDASGILRAGRKPKKTSAKPANTGSASSGYSGGSGSSGTFSGSGYYITGYLWFKIQTFIILCMLFPLNPLVFAFLVILQKVRGYLLVKGLIIYRISKIVLVLEGILAVVCLVALLFQ